MNKIVYLGLVLVLMATVFTGCRDTMTESTASTATRPSSSATTTPTTTTSTAPTVMPDPSISMPEGSGTSEGIGGPSGAMDPRHPGRPRY